MIPVPEHVRSLVPYSPGKPLEELERELGISGSIKLASNENPLGPSAKAVAAVKKAAAGLHRYPDGSGHDLTAALAGRYGVGPDRIILGNGSNELIELAVRAFVQPGDEVISAAPSFVVYASAAQAAGGVNVIVPCTENRHDLAAMAARITPRTRIVFVANPNNPTGTMNTAAEMDRLVERLPEHVLLVLDEAYFEYVVRSDYPESLAYVAADRNVLVLRTFSKIYGLAGLRIGYGIAAPDIVATLNKVRQPFNTGSPSQAGAQAALADQKHVERSLALNSEGKQFLSLAFERMGISFVPTEANFIWFETGRDAAEVYQALLRLGVIIRPMGGRRLRVTIGLPEENVRFVKALESVLNGQ